MVEGGRLMRMMLTTDDDGGQFNAAEWGGGGGGGRGGGGGSGCFGKTSGVGLFGRLPFHKFGSGGGGAWSFETFEWFGVVAFEGVVVFEGI